MQTKKKINADRLYNRLIKRILDFAAALFFTILLLPLFLLIAIVVVVDSGFPVFYRAQRGGFHNKPFRIFKFRTMVKNADQIGGGTTALNDPRITRVGNFLRKTKLDEIPQLFNILAGDMSFIGPRPELLRYTDAYAGEELSIFLVRPGITDYSSIEFINLDEVVGSEDADAYYEKYVLRRKNALRVKYAETVAFGTDVRLLFVTVWYVLKKAFRFIFRRKDAS